MTMASLFLRIFFFFMSIFMVATPAFSNEEDNEFGILFNAPGVETTYYACSACHSERIVAQQGLNRKGWEEMLVWMVEEQGMFELEDAERNEVLDYLTTHYNVDRPNFPKRKTN